ncbi:MAG TPA: DMT family transporter [Mycobacteriales bacterium]|nr:DMT family transporter [Mycobacteriales bacterium]
MATLLALLSSGLWGTADFLGGTASRRLPLIAVVGVSQAVGALGMLIAAVLTGALDASPGYVGWAVLGALSGTGGLLAFYEALATGTMGVVAPIAALGVVVPVAVGIAQGDRPNAVQAIGVVVAIAGVVLASGPELRNEDVERRRAARPLLLAVVAAAGFGVVFVCVDHGARTSTIMMLFSMRAISVALFTGYALATGWKRQMAITAADLPLLAMVGIFDVSANATFAYATQHGLLSLVAVLSSLYPAVTVILARFVHSERLKPVQLSGVVAALAGVVLIASTGTG